MIPRLYPQEEWEFQNNGIGLLSDAVACFVSSAMGSEELAMQYPIGGRYFKEICNRAIILAKPDPHKDPQPYRIYSISKPMGGLVTVNAQHLCYDLMGVPVKPFSATNAVLALQGLKENALVPCKFDFWTDKATTASFAVPVPASIWQCLAGIEWSALAAFGGEYEFDGHTVRLYGRRGADRGVSIRYGKNLTSLQQDENCASCYTGLLPYWQDTESGKVITLPEYIIKVAGNYDYTRILSMDFSSDFTEGEPTQAQLRARGEKYIKANKLGVPEISWKVSFAQLEKAEEYRGTGFLERVSMGDTVAVIFPDLDVEATARVVEAKYDCLLDRFESVTLGSVRQSLASTIVSQKKELETKASSKNMATILAAAIESATASITGAHGGSVRFLDTDGDGEPDTLYIADDPDPEKAQKVWRFNYEGWGASTSGYSGPFRTAATLSDGIVADMITSGVLNANLIKAGTIRSADGSFSVNLDTGEVSIQYVDENITKEVVNAQKASATTKHYILQTPKPAIPTSQKPISEKHTIGEFVLGKDTLGGVMPTSYQPVSVKHMLGEFILGKDILGGERYGVWMASEPGYEDGEQTCLWEIDCIHYADGTWMYTNLEKSQRYEDARNAYNSTANTQHALYRVNQELSGSISDLNATLGTIQTKITDMATNAGVKSEIVSRLKSYAMNDQVISLVGAAEQRFFAVVDGINQQLSPLLQTEGYIKMGWIQDEWINSSMPLFGIAIGQSVQYVNNTESTYGGETHKTVAKKGFLAIYTASEIGFWVNTVKVAYISNQRLYITNVAAIEAITLGPGNGKWRIDATNGLAFKWIGGVA